MENEDEWLDTGRIIKAALLAVCETTDGAIFWPTLRIKQANFHSSGVSKDGVLKKKKKKEEEEEEENETSNTIILTAQNSIDAHTTINKNNDGEIN